MAWLLRLRRDEAALRGGGGQPALTNLGAEEQGQGHPDRVEPLSAVAQESAAARLPAHLHHEGQARDPLRGTRDEQTGPGDSAASSSPDRKTGRPDVSEAEVSRGDS